MLLFPLAEAAAPEAVLRPGDVVFQRSTSAQAEAIAHATHSELTHVGVVLDHDGALAVLEAVQPVKWTDPAAWVARGVPGSVLVRRLADPAPLVAPGASAALARVAAGFLGRNYDLAFSWSDDRLYCSELVHKLFARALGVDLSPLRTLREFDLLDPVVAPALAARYGKHVPFDEPVVAPSDLAASVLLTPVSPE